METFGKAVSGGLVVFNLLGVILGYAAIAKMKVLDMAPFDLGGTGPYMYAVFGRVPDWMLLAWDSTGGSLLIWTCCLILPLPMLMVMYLTERKWIGWTVLWATAAFIGWTGCTIFFNTLLSVQ